MTELTPEYLTFLPPNSYTRQRIAGSLAMAGIGCDDIGVGLRCTLGEIDWKCLLEGLGTVLSEFEKRDTRVAVIPRDADEKARRKAIALARPLADLLDEYSDSWLCGLMQRNALSIHFQPLVQYPPGRVHGYECLLRGVGEDGRLIPPARLFDAARRLGMAYLLDRQSCRTALANAADTGFSNISFFINVMAGAIEDPIAHARATAAAVEMGGMRADQITFEVVDAEAQRDRKHLGAIISNLREAGFGISLDDVAAGAVSLISLADLQPDYIKLDGDLCRRAADHDEEAKTLRGVSAAARQRGIIVVAKGIETEEQLRFAIDSGVRVTQGYVHAQPQSTPLDAGGEDQVLRQVRRTAVLAV